MSTIFNSWIRPTSTELYQPRLQDDAISKLVPKIKTIFSKETMPSAKLYDGIGDFAVVRFIPRGLGEITGDSISGSPLVGLTSALYTLIGVGRVVDNFRKAKVLEKIGDAFGATVAKVQIVVNSFLGFASVAFSYVRIFDAVKELFELLKMPLFISSTLVTIKTVASIFSTTMFVGAYTIYAGLQAIVLYDLSKGDELRNKLIESENPMAELSRHIDQEMWDNNIFTEAECIDMALEEGAIWLEKLEKEVEKFPWTDESRKDVAYMLFVNNPEFMMTEMGEPIGFDEMTPEGKMVRFGQFIGEKRLAAKIENDLIRQLGPDAMEIFKQEAPDNIAFVTALKSADWSEWGIRWKTVAKIALSILCSAAIIGANVSSGGLALGIPLLILGVTGLLWIVLTDGASFMAQWKSGDIGKWDKFLVGFSSLLNLVALGASIAFTVLSGGAPIYVAGIIFATAWLIINAYSIYLMIDNQREPWKYQKEVTVQAFKKFLETKPSDEEKEKIYNKMSLVNRAGISELGSVERWEERLKELRERNFAMLMDCLNDASEDAQVARQYCNLPAS